MTDAAVGADSVATGAARTTRPITVAALTMAASLMAGTDWHRRDVWSFEPDLGTAR